MPVSKKVLDTCAVLTCCVCGCSIWYSTFSLPKFFLTNTATVTESRYQLGISRDKQIDWYKDHKPKLSVADIQSFYQTPCYLGQKDCFPQQVKTDSLTLRQPSFLKCNPRKLNEKQSPTWHSPLPHLGEPAFHPVCEPMVSGVDAFELFSDLYDRCRLADSSFDQPYNDCTVTNVYFPATGSVPLAIVDQVTTFPPARNLLSMERKSLRVPGSHKRYTKKSIGQATAKQALGLLGVTDFNSIVCTSLLKGTTFILRRWHAENFVHLFEALFRLYQSLKRYGNPKALPNKVLVLDSVNFNTNKRGGANASGHLLHEELLSAFGVHFFLETLPEPLCLEEAVFVGYPQLGLVKPDMKVSELREFISIIRTHLRIPNGLVSGSLPHVSIISRRGTLQAGRPRRYMVEEEALVNTLKSSNLCNVKLVQLEDMSFREQATLISQTDVLFGVHSSALFHLVWMKQDSVVIQLHQHGTCLGNFAHASRAGLLSWFSGTHPYIILNVEKLAKDVGVVYKECWPDNTTGPPVRVSQCMSLHSTSHRCLQAVQAENTVFRYEALIRCDVNHLRDTIVSAFQNPKVVGNTT